MKTLSFLLAITLAATALPAQSQPAPAPPPPQVISAGGTTYKLPDPNTLQSPEAVHSGLATAEMAAKALTADAAVQTDAANSAAADDKKNQQLLADYNASRENYDTKEAQPFIDEAMQYRSNLNRYDSVLANYQAQAAANNSLQPAQRNAANVDRLNHWKEDLDTWKGKLDTWLTTLTTREAAILKDSAALMQQRQRYIDANEQAGYRLNLSQRKLKYILDQLLLCKAYAGKCREILKKRYNVTPGKSAPGYFGTTVYQGTLDDLKTELEKLKANSDIPFDNRKTNP